MLASADAQDASSDNEIVTLEVPKPDAAEVTAASAAGDVSLAEVSASARR
jgi:Flp pilus assembly protein CpaB